MHDQLAVIEFKAEFQPGHKEPIDWVLLAPKGESFEKSQTWRRVSKIQPDPAPSASKKASLTHQHMDALWSVVGPAYESWKAGSEIPETGTPLAAWGALTKEQADAFRAYGCKTVEDVAALGPDAAASLAFPNARRMPEMAGKFLSQTSVIEKDAEIDALKKQVEQLAAMAEVGIEGVTASPNAALMAEDKPKRGPGRPRKED